MLAQTRCDICYQDVERAIDHVDSPCLISISRVVLLTLLSSGLYVFWWFYITWKQYREHMGVIAYPVWHSLALLVPIYSFFRVYAHAVTYRRLLGSSGSSVWTTPVLAVFAFVGMVLFENLDIFMSVSASNRGLIDTLSIITVHAFGGLSNDFAGLTLFAMIGSTICAMWLISSVQADINRYWRSALIERHVQEAQIGKGEVFFVVIGIALWTRTLITVLNS